MNIRRAGSVVFATRRRRGVAAIALTLAAGTVAAPIAGASLLGGSTPSAPNYIVSDPLASTLSAVTSLVGNVGGTIVAELGVANAVSAVLSPLEVTLLGLIPGVIVTPNVSVSVAGTASTVSGEPPAAVFSEQSGATQLWAQGDNGSGINVAVLDTGIDAVPDLAGRLVGGVDLTGDGNPFDDEYGHGTFVAGLIAGDGASSDGQYEGEAPGAGLVSVKVAGANGTTDLATVLEGVGWTISHAASLHIRVLNMSLGFVPFTSTALNPLDIAVQQAWNAGIVVVASAGNDGPDNGTILSPGDDPEIITAGAVNDLGQTNPSDDLMTTFSSVGPTSPDGWLKPDLVTSGASVVSLAAPGSTVYDDNPNARIGSGNFFGSGTSFSAAITSGAAALILSKNPNETPNQVKAALLATTSRGPVGNPFVDGHGILDVAAAAADTTVQLNQNVPTISVGIGSNISLHSSWADSSWNPANWTGLQNPPTTTGSPTGEVWNGEVWNGEVWNGEVWNGEVWNGEVWNGEVWNGDAWDGEVWNGEVWNGDSWS